MSADTPENPETPRSSLPLQVTVGLVAAAGFTTLSLLGLMTAVGAGAAFALTLMLAAWVQWRDSIRMRALRERMEQIRRSRRSPPPLRAKIAEGIGEPLLLLDPAKRVLDANRAARTLLGERIVERDVALHLRHPNVLEAISKVVDGAPAQMIEITMTGPVERNYAVSVAPVSNRSEAEDGQDESPDFYIVISMHDITQMKTVERMRADFVANASHELRTPLTSVIGFIETLRGPARGDPEASERFLSIMNDESQRMVRLIDDLLSLSRIELDKHLQPETEADPQGIAQSVARSLQPVAEAAEARIDVALADDLPALRGDPDQLFQMLQNLVANALKYGGKGVRVTIGAEAVARIPETGHPGLKITVADTGPGIAPEHIPRLTERFYRVDAARSRKLGGTGLGLAIVKHIVTRHRGHLDIRSRPGEGTVVSVSLPLFEAPEKLAATGS